MGRDLYYTFIRPFQYGDFEGYAIGIMFWIMALIILGLILWGLIYLVDSTFMPDFQGNGKIVDKEKIDAHTTTNMVKIGNSTVPIMTKHPDAYYVDIEIDGRTDSVQVKKNFYKQAEIGDVVKCKYNLGRLFTTSLYINEIA